MTHFSNLSIFNQTAHFSNLAIFHEPAHFSNLSIFHEPAHFSNLSIFHEPAHFSNLSKFYEPAHFSNNAIFHEPAHFSNLSIFHEPAHFSNLSKFHEPAHFSNNAIFHEHAHFSNLSIFHEHAHFSNNAIFHEPAHFSNSAIFNQTAHFSNNTIFNQTAHFSNSAIFYEQAHFSNLSIFHESVDFTNTTTFNKAPEFATTVAFEFPVNFSNITTFSGPLRYLSDASITYTNDMMHFNNNRITYQGETGFINFDQTVSIRDLIVTDNLIFGENINLSNFPGGGGGGGGSCGGSGGSTMVNPSNLIVSGTMTLCNTRIEGILILGNSDLTVAYSNIPDSNLSQVEGTLVIDSNLYVGGRIYCNGLRWSEFENAELHDTILYGTATFCNTQIHGVLQIGREDGIQYLFSNDVPSNAEYIDKDLYVNGRIFANGIQWSSVNNYVMDNGIIQGKTTFCNIQLDGILTIGNTGSYTAYSNIPNDLVNHVEGALVVNEDLYVAGRLFCNGFTFSSCNFFTFECDTFKITNRSFFYSNVTFSNAAINFNNSRFTTPVRFGNDWSMYVSNRNELTFESINNTSVKFSDNFTTEILNFTGKHRCSWHNDELPPNHDVGKIVIATGTYLDLNDNAEITMDEAIPIIDLSTKSNDPRIFGVIAGIEDSNASSRNYRIGHIELSHHKSIKNKKVIVNSVGEGAILVCNMNGNFKNGDLITTCEIPGLGARQKSNQVKSYTVAKITCDCDFKISPLELIHNNKIYKQALVGCVYKC